MATPLAGMNVVLSSGFNYRSKVLSRFLTGTTLNVTNSGDVRSLRAGVGLERDQWELSLYGENLLDDRDPISPPDANVANNTVHERPRTIGLQVMFHY